MFWPGLVIPLLLDDVDGHSTVRQFDGLVELDRGVEGIDDDVGAN